MRTWLTRLLGPWRAARVRQGLTRDALLGERAAEEIEVTKANPWPPHH